MGKVNKVKKKTSAAAKGTTVSISVPANRKIGKKERLKAKKKLLHEKLEAGSLKARKERVKKAVPMLKNMKSMRDCLSELAASVENEQANNVRTKSSKTKGTQKQKKRKRDFMAHVRMFSMISTHEEFKQDPLGIISSHIEAKSQMEFENREENKSVPS
jgi:hypothetical protein